MAEVPCGDGVHDDGEQHDGADHEEEHDDAHDVLGVVVNDEEPERTPSWEMIAAPLAVKHEGGDDEHEDGDGLVVVREDDEGTCNDDVQLLLGVRVGVALVVDVLLPRLPQRQSGDAPPIPFLIQRDLQRDGVLERLQ